MSHRQVKAENTLHNEIIGVSFIAIASLIFLSIIGYNIGILKTLIEKPLLYAFGKGAILFCLLLYAIGIKCIFKDTTKIFSIKFFSIICFFFSLLLLYHNYISPENSEILPESLTTGGGLFSGIIVFFSRKFLGLNGTWVFLVALTISLVIFAFKISMKKTVQTAVKTTVKAMDIVSNKSKHSKEDKFFDYEKFLGKIDEQNQLDKTEYIEAKQDFSKAEVEIEEKQLPILEEVSFPISETKNSLQTIFLEEKQAPILEFQEEKNPLADYKITVDGYVYPPLNLLTKPKHFDNNDDLSEVNEQAKILEQTLEDFKVSAKIINVVNGSSVTRFELEPAPGVKVNKITSLVDDLSLRLAVSNIRIETSIPGKSAMGIEVPKKKTMPVSFYDVISSKEFQDAKSKLTVALGKEITGKTVIADISQMPHTLVAGSTGSGKSVCINTIVNSILFKAAPEDVKFIMIDPKVVELSIYNGIPHLLVPVVTDAKKAAAALFWAVQEMERRYKLFAESNVREITKYNGEAQEKLPYIVIIIDELADLMMIAPSDVEDAICRLAQKARASGIHLILATQRPSVDVITGIIKANIPSRIAFAVSSQVDSRTILDSGGAEKLLGKGDMLYSPVGTNKPFRLQGAFINDDDIKNVTNFIKHQEIKVEYTHEVTECSLPSEKGKTNNTDTLSQSSDHDELTQQALDIIMQTGQATASFLQRRLKIGYSRAGRLIDVFEEKGIIGPATGTSKPRDILLTYEQALEKLQL